jgi:hypothetical protein
MLLKRESLSVKYSCPTNSSSVFGRSLSAKGDKPRDTDNDDFARFGFGVLLVEGLFNELRPSCGSACLFGVDLPNMGASLVGLE